MRNIIASLSLALALSAGATEVAFSAKDIFPDATPACGGTNHLCITLTQAKDHNKRAIVSAKNLGPTGGVVRATWSGNVNCKINAKTLAANHFEAEVQAHLQLVDRSNTGVEIGGQGGATVGFLVTQPVNFIHGETTPVTLTRLFEPTTQNLVVLARPVFKTGTNGSCAVNGGSFVYEVIK